MKIQGYRFAVLALGLLLGTSVALKAQEGEENTYNESVIMRSSFSPVVSEAYKLGIKPDVFSSEFELPAFSYDKTSFRFPTSVHFDKIKPAKVKGEPVARLYNTHLRGAIGTYFTSLFDASYSLTRSKDLVYGAQYSHRSSLGQIKDYANSSYANNDLVLYGKKIWNSFSLDAKVNYSHQRHYYYGFSDTLDIEKKDYRAQYHTLGAQINYRSLYREEKKFHNAASFDVKHTMGKWGNKETDLFFKAGVHREFSLFGDKPQNIGLSVTYNQIFGSFNPKDLTPYHNTELNLEKTDNRQGSVDIRAYMDFYLQRFKIHADLSFMPAFGNSKHFYFLPTVTVAFPTIADCLEVMAGVKSGSVTPTLLSFIRENPYISPLVHTELQSSTDFFAQAAYRHSNGFFADLEAGYDAIRNKYFYTLDANAKLNNMFTLVYDNVKRFYSTLSFGYLQDNLKLYVDLMYQNLNTEKLEAAWYTPAFKTSLAFEYTAAGKLTFAIIPAFSTKEKCLDENGEIKTLKAKFNLNLNASYRYSDQLMFFVELNNLAFQRYYNYYNYPTQKFVGLLGLRFAF